MKRRLLIISCSSRKKHFGALTPAWQVYDGVMYRCLKKLQASGHFPKNVDILIISAEFGVLLPSTPIPYYDLMMTVSRALVLRKTVSKKLNRLLQENKYDEIIISMGHIYIETLKNIEWPKHAQVGSVPGKVGQKLQLTKEWIMDPLSASKKIVWLQGSIA